jgi:hypothetical protein
MTGWVSRRDSEELFEGSGVYTQQLLQRDSPRAGPQGRDYAFNFHDEDDERLRPGTYDVEVVMSRGTVPNDYTLSVLPDRPTCGDGRWSHGEECDPSGSEGPGEVCGGTRSCDDECHCE